MIGRLRGTLAEKHAPWLLVDVHGVGYEVEAPMSTFFQLPEVGAEVVLYTHLAVREDNQTLYGFLSTGERSLFRNLIRISGVGARMALAILSAMSAAEFAACIECQDVAALTRIPGIGKKTAQRLLVELRDRPGLTGVAGGAAAGGTVSAAGDPVQEAAAALAALGYKPQEARSMVEKVGGEGLGSEELIRRALSAAGARFQ